MKKIETTTDCIKAAQELLEEAREVSNKKEHGEWWDRKVDVLRVINGAFETGAFTGDAYQELWQAKNILFRSEGIAGRYAE